MTSRGDGDATRFPLSSQGEGAGGEVIILGAGAAGLLCALEAAQRGRDVLLLERNDQVGRKILISGGGRCNFTNLWATPEQYITDNPNFHRSALARYSPQDFIALIEKHRISYHEKKLGQLFCDGSARQVVDMLLHECREAGVRIQTNCEVWSVTRADINPAPNEADNLQKSPSSAPPLLLEERGLGGEVRGTGGGVSPFHLETSTGDYTCDALVVATGGLSIPKMGATSFAHQLAAQFGIPVTETRPGLVPLTFDGEELDFCNALTGLSIDAVVRCNGQSFAEAVLFTHRGLSGPAILQASSYWREGDTIEIDLIPDHDDIEFLTEAAVQGWGLARVLETMHPRRFAQSWAQRYGPSTTLDRLFERDLEALAHQLHYWRLTPSGTEGYAKAEVTVGGIDTRALDSRTMACRDIPNLYFIGECVDVTGWLGGYNFQWAWASAHAAAQCGIL